MRCHTDEQRLREGCEDAEQGVLGFGIGCGRRNQAEAQGLAAEGEAVFEDVVEDVVLDELGMLFEQRVIEALAFGVVAEDFLFLASGAGAETQFEVMDALEEALRCGWFGEAQAQNFRDELKLVGWLRLEVVHDGLEPQTGRSASAVGEDVRGQGGVGFAPVGERLVAGQGLEATHGRSQEVQALPQRIAAVAEQGENEIADGETDLARAEVGSVILPDGSISVRQAKRPRSGPEQRRVKENQARGLGAGEVEGDLLLSGRVLNGARVGGTGDGEQVRAEVLLNAAETFLVEEGTVSGRRERHARVVACGRRRGVEDDEVSYERLEHRVRAVPLEGSLVDGDAPAATAGVFAGRGDTAKGFSVAGLQVFAGWGERPDDRQGR